VTLADQLSALDAAADAPAWSQLGREPELLDEAHRLDSELVPELAQVIVRDWDEVADRASAAAVVVRRLGDVPSPLGFARAAELAVALAVVEDGAALAEDLVDVLLEAAAPGLTQEADAEEYWRAGIALRCATDLVLLSEAPHYRLFDALQRLRGNLPEGLSRATARCVGRLSEHFGDQMLRDLLREDALASTSAATDAAVELGYASLRDAFAAADTAHATRALTEARDLFAAAEDGDEDRPDAEVFGAAAELVLAFAAGSGPDALGAPLDRMRLGATRLAMWDQDDDGPTRPVTQSSGWLALASHLRRIAQQLADPNWVELRGTLLALVDVYAGVRLRVLDREELGLEAAIRPRVTQWLGDEPTARVALETLTKSLPEDSGAGAVARELLAASEAPPGKARLCHFPPGWPGC
jgi:hypothetical protein